MATRRGCQDRSPRERKSPAGLGESPPVLTLSHFCPKPFLCFGNVRLGASKTLPLALLNPNAEAAAVTLPRCPAAAQGFEVWPSALELQPKEKNVISVNWTPIKGGRVREILTFHVNGIVKHEVILLGNAEEPKKKKRSLWDTINKKKVSAPSSRKKRISNIQNVNETFSVSQKVDRVRSPLQACENLGRKEGCSPTENSSLILEGDKIPISPISPTFKGCRGEPGLPLCVRRSTTYTCLHASENGELWKLEDANISKGFNEKVLTETSVDSINNNSQVEEESKLTVTPNCPSTLNVSQSHGSFLSPDSFVKNSHAADHELKSVPCMSSDTFLKDDSRPVHLESKPVHEAYRTILSPDSFLKDNYGLSAEVESESVSPILSSSRCVEDNVTRRSLSQQTCKLSPFLNGYSQASESPPVQRKNEVLLCIPECQSSDFPGTIFEGPKSSEMKPNCDSFTKHNQPGFSAVQDISGYSHKTQLKRRPVLSATVTKLKPTGNRENKTETSQPKARRCLCSVEGEDEKVADSAEERDTLRSYLPVIEPAVSSPTSCKTAVDSSSRAASAARKRKSEGNVEGARVLVGVAEHTEAPATEKIRFSPWASTTSAAKKTRKVIMPVSNPASSREKLHPKKRLDSLAHKTPSSKTNGRTKRVVPVAQSHLTFIKPLKTDVPRHPMPFAARNMFYDERWKEKQQQGFTWWLNFVLTPDDLTVKTSVSEVNAAALLLGVENQHKLSVPRAPTKDEMSLRAYTARCRLNRLRRAACRLFTSEKMVQAIKKLEIEIEARRLVVRKDRHLWKDVGERQKVLRWLLSYNPLWLRIGLETVFGELVALEDNSDVMGMAVFIVSRLLWNPDLAAEYRHPSVPHLYRDGHEEALSRFTLKKLLLLVCFLDHAKVSRLIDHDPCLFCKDAEFKTSKDLLLAFSRDFLSGEGDLSRHLSLLGLPVSHVQTPFDEFDFAVTNLAVDLQCGVRLVRAVELLTQNWNLSKSLRVPAISRLQKIHNVDLALQALRVRGVRLQDEHGNAILPKDIVDRHREKTLALLWSIALALQVDVSLDLDQLKEEIDFLRHTWSLRKTVPAPSSRLEAARGAQAGPEPRGSPAQQSESVGLLMAWVNALCTFYGTRVENFTVSFSDGRVLCYLIHHYHPGCVPFHAICQRTTQTVECAQTGSVVLNSSSESEESCLDVSLKAPDPENADVHRELLENERRNFQLVGSAVRDLGGVPAMLHHADMSNTIPDEKVVITFLSFLCARLLDLRRETRAARLIQTAWRRHKVKSDLRRRQERDKAARIIQSAITRFLARRRLKKEVSAARVIQKSWRRFLRQRELLMLRKAELEKIQSKSALVIQKYWRRYSTRKKFLTLKKYSIILQSRIRAKMAVASYKRCVRAAVTIQSQWRACVRRRQDQQRYKTLRSSCLIIQSAFRRWQRRQMRRRIKAAITLQGAFRQWRARKRAKEEKSATVIQSWYRMHRELRRYSHTRSCVLTIQTEFRRFRAQKLYKRKREAIRTIQTRWRAHLEARGARARYLQKLAAAVCIQAAFRAVRARRLRRQNAAACVLQAYWRMRQERLRFLALRNTVVTLQAHVRKHQQLQKYKKMQKAALVIQTRFRAHIAARTVLASYQRMRSAAIVLQAACRARRARKAVHHTLTCVIRIQACYRAHVCRKHFLSLKHTTVKLQSMVRRQQARKRYLQLRAAVVFVQQRYRFLQRATRRLGELRQVLEACVRLQAWARGHQVRRQVRLQRAAATSLQAHFRMRTVRRGYLRMRQAALVIQRCYRAHRVWLRQQEALRARRAATCLQAAFRGHCVRRLLRRRALAALTIQSAFRGHRERANYRRVLQSAVQIQRWYRANCAARGLRTRFLKVRAAVLTLQAAYRGWRVREQISRDRLAAVALQAAFRRARDQRRFQQLKAAALALQRHRRAQAAGRAQRRDYLRLRRAVLTLQAACRGRAARRQIQRQHACATLIQSCYRMHAQRRRWVAVRKAARLIQTWFRACCQGRRQRLAYLKTKAAVLVLQSAHRRMRERRKRAEERTKAAATIQARYRAYRAKKRRAACRAAAVTIQRWYRSVKIADCQHKEYLHLKKSATRIQAIYRGVQVRRHIGRMHMAATFIKATFQMHLLKRRFRKMRAAAVIIQVRYRAYCRGKTQRAQYLAVLKAVDILQAGFRGARVRWNLRRMQAAAVVIQSGYRRHREQARFRRVKAATKTVQRRYRALKAGNEQFERYRQLRRAAILLQAAFRGMRARRRVKAMHSAAVLIQRRVRALRTRRRFLSLRKTALWVQRKYRAKVHNKHHLAFLRLQEAAITIQSSFRGWAVRKRLQEMCRAATVIQATFRMHRAQVSYQALRHAAVLMQRRYRVCRAAELQRERFVRQRHSAVVIQAAYRGWRARQLLQGTHRAAVLIQSTYRMHRQYVFYRKVQWATKLIQEKYRANKRKALEPRALAEAGARVQAGPPDLAMVEQAQEQHLAATTVQKHFRGFRVRKRYLRLRAAVVFVQRRYRAIAAARTLAALHLQASQGGAREQRGTRGGHPATPRIQPSCSTHGAHAARPVRRGTAAALQSRCRPRVGVKTRRRRSSAVQTPTPAAQAAFRDTETGLELENATKEEVAATADRPASRWALAETRQEAAWSSVVGPPTCSEALVACSPAAVGHSQSRAAVTVPNAFHTMAAGTLDLELWAALRVQSFLGTAACRRRFVQQRRAAITLQLSFRARRARRQLWLWRRAAVVLQTRLRACLSAKRQRRAYLWARSSAIIIQAKTRGLLQKRRFLKIRESALKMQRSDGRASVRLLRFAAAAYHHLCAVRIQRAYRRHLAVQDARSHLHAVVCTQRQCPTRSQLKRWMQMPQSVLNVDREVEEHQRRRHRAASVIQRAVRCFLRLREQERFRNGVIKVQALWRGYSWRKKNGCAQIEAVRRRLQMVSAEVREENTLSRRAALALHHLLTYRHLSAVLEALKHLEVVTRLSPLCCESVAQSGGVSKVLVLIRSCNRSVPCMDVICYAVQVLLNLAKYEKTMPAVRGDEACVDTLLQLLQRYREKPGDKVADKSRSIFSKTCCLLAVVLKATGRASDVRNRPDVVDCVYSVYKLTARKHTVNTERMPCKENKNGSLSTPFTPDTAVRTRAVPRLQPDWVLSRDNMQEIGDPLHAIQMVMDTLGIPF